MGPWLGGFWLGGWFGNLIPFSPWEPENFVSATVRGGFTQAGLEGDFEAATVRGGFET